MYLCSPSDGTYVMLMGKTAIGDQKGTLWKYDASSSVSDNFEGGTAKPTANAGNGRWIRQDNAPFFSADHTPTRTFGTAFQPSTGFDSEVFYTISISCTLSLSGGQDGEVQLQTSPDNVTYTTKSKFGGSNTGSLTLGLNTAQKSVGLLSCKVPKGYYVKIVTVNNTSTPAFGLIQSIENY